MKMLNQKHFCGVDIGASRIKAAVLKLNDENIPELMGVFEHETHGFKDGAVSDLGELSDCIHKTILELTKKVDIKLKDVCVGVNGEIIQVRETSTVIPLSERGSKIITSRDIRKVDEQAQLLGIKIEEDLLHSLSQHYIIDDDNTAVNPLGLYGRKLGVKALLVISAMNRIRNIAKSVNHAGYDIAQLSFTPLAAADVILTEQERIAGTVLIDIGAKETTVMTFKDNVIRSIETIGIGSEHLTKAIARHLNLPLDLAEQIKKSYAAAQGAEGRSDEEILVKRESVYVPIRREDIYAAIEEDLERFVIDVTRSIGRISQKISLNGSATMVGGGTLLPGLLERIGQASYLNVRLGKVHVHAQKPLSYTAVFAGAVGLAYRGLHSARGKTAAVDGGGPWTKKITEKVVELYQEYF